MRLPRALLLTLPLITLAGCGSGQDAIEGARKQPNDFASVKNPIDDFSPGSTGDSTNNGGLETNEVRITMEVPASAAPDAELTRRNLRIVQPDSVTVYRTNTSLQQLDSVDVSRRTDSQGFTVIGFPSGLPLAPDILIEARYGNITMRAPAADSDRDVKINPFSEYLVRNGLGNYTAGELSQILDCVDDAGGSLCLNKYVWSTLADQIHDFEIDIPGNLDLEGAITLLDNRGDFARYVAAMADYALLDETSSGKISASSADYNSVFFGIELGQSFAEPSISGAGLWGARTTQEECVAVGDLGCSAYVYPALTLTSFDAFNIRVTSLATDVPYDREVLLHREGTSGDEFFVRGSEVWELNTHSSSPGAATLVDDTRLLAGRSLYQSITGRGTSRITGWTRNPYYLDAYTSIPDNENLGPDRVLASYFSAGKAIELESEGTQLKRRDTLENHYLSALEIHLLRPAQDDEFDASVLPGDYNVVYLATRFSDDSSDSTRLELETGLGTWTVASDRRISQSLAQTRVRRDDSGTVTIDTAGALTTDWLVSPRQSRLSTSDRQIGRLNLDIDTASGAFETPDIGTGASTPDGTLLAFNLDDSPLGEGVLVAAKQTIASAPTSGEYRLQGALLSASENTNRLRHIDNARLTIESGVSATVEGELLTALHTLPAASLASPQAEPVSSTFAYTQPGLGRVLFVNGNWTLDGFHSEDGSQLFLRATTSDQGEQGVGLLIATKLP